MSALPPKADIERHDWHVCFVPICDIARLLNHLVGTRLQRQWHGEAERLRGLEVDHQLELGWLLHWKISGLGTPKDFVDVAGGTPKEVNEICPIGQEPAGCRKFSKSM